MKPRSVIVRELLWLLVILLAALPLEVGLHVLVQRVPGLAADLDAVLPPAYVEAVLYGLVVLACYLGRLGAYGATRLAHTIPQEAGLA